MYIFCIDIQIATHRQFCLYVHFFAHNFNQDLNSAAKCMQYYMLALRYLMGKWITGTSCHDCIGVALSHCSHLPSLTLCYRDWGNQLRLRVECFFSEQQLLYWHPANCGDSFVRYRRKNLIKLGWEYEESTVCSLSGPSCQCFTITVIQSKAINR